MQQCESIIYIIARCIIDELQHSEICDVVSVDTTLYCILYECQNKTDNLAMTRTKLNLPTKSKLINILADVFFKNAKYKARKKHKLMIQTRLSFIEQFPVKSTFLLNFYTLSS
jgi:hypothetical protein